MKTRKVFLAAMSRTAITKMGGKQSRVEPANLGAHVLANAVRRANIVDKSLIDLIVFGHAVQSYFAPNTARYSALNMAGLPASIEAFTEQEQCISGMKAAETVFRRISAGAAKLGIVVGVESMSRTPLIISPEYRYGAFAQFLLKHFPKQMKLFGPLPFLGVAESGLGPRKLASEPESLFMIRTAQVVGELLGVTREDADAFAAESQKRALAARKRLAMEIDPMVVPGVGLVDLDEHPRETTMETLASLRDQANSGIITAGNASGMGDGACALVFCCEEMLDHLGVTPLSEIVDFYFTGRDARTMGLGPVDATLGLCERNGITVGNVGYFEMNEPFAVVAEAGRRRLGIPMTKMNHNGGGISLSHPLGMTGARIIGTAAYEMLVDDSIDDAISTLCGGGGLGGACYQRRVR